MSVDVSYRTSMLSKDDIPFEQRWMKMRPVIQNLLCQHDVSRDEWQQLFWDAHAAVQWDIDGSEKLQAALINLVRERLSEIDGLLKENASNLSLLINYGAEWNKFKAQLTYLPEPFRSLETEFLEKTNEECCIEDLLLIEWKSVFIKYEEGLKEAALKLINQERDGSGNDYPDIVKAMTETYTSLSQHRTQVTSGSINPMFPTHECDNFIYKPLWEDRFFEKRETFYKTKVNAKLEKQPTATEYMKFAMEAYEFENKLTAKYLNESSIKKSGDLMTEVLVDSPSEIILSAIEGLFMDLDKDSLSLAFQLLKHSKDPDNLRKVRRCLSNYITNKGAEKLRGLSDGDSAVTSFLDLYNETDVLIEFAFDNHYKFTTGRDHAFRVLMNDPQIFEKETKCPELLATHVDGLLRKKALCRKYSQDEIEGRLLGIVKILKYVDGKDLFMRHHKLHLTRRLVLNVSNNRDQEEEFVECLRDIGMPAEYINKLTRMFQDVSISGDLNKDCKEFLKKDLINVKVLSAGAWVRGLSRFPIQLPHEVEESIGQIEEFYKNRHTGRKLTFHPLLSHGTMAFESKVGKYELDVTALQMAVLSCWNRRANQELSMEDLCLGSMLPESEIIKTLISLTQNPKLKIQLILTKPQVAKNTKEFAPGMTFRVNRAFALIKGGKAATRGKVSLIGRLPLTAEKNSRKEDDEVYQLRTLRVQEAALKVLKARRKINVQNLSSELIELLKSQFLPSKKMIKEQLEWLLDQEFAERDNSQKDLFLYKA